ncbi:TPA_asm: VanZ family protein, partial [Listeria monocytogenes]|nr:VanZ family protein [Listeria monocytogenes]EAD8102330.1 VanZ family protein [Listeria monocytogenes]EAF0071520.1 VanZ family protein [Listeria monocytogenes]EAG0571402.1 VanZ family protein [Listeria monocytogenes]EAG0647770.1 VanZ family protein [Listeria monocytogenes]
MRRVNMLRFSGLVMTIALIVYIVF